MSTSAGTTSYEARAWAAAGAKSPLAPTTIRRRNPRPQDVQIDVLFCGVCHSDLHQVRNEWENSMPTVYPCVAGHEIVGRVVKVGSAVTKFKEGDLAAVGCVVDSDRTCPACRDDQQVFCEAGATFTYNAPDPHLGGVTLGGYSTSIVVDEAFTLRLAPGADLAGTAPLLCAGITTYSPLRHWNVREGQKVGIVGLGGLGHMGVKIANALGARVVVLTTSARKTEDALRLGAKEVVVSTDAAAMQKQAGSFDFILDTVSAPHDVNALVGLVKRNGTLTLVGAPPTPHPISAFGLIFGRKQLAGSMIGGLKETQEMLEFCAAHGLASDVEVIPMQKINDAYERLLKGDVKYRFVVDMASLR